MSAVGPESTLDELPLEVEVKPTRFTALEDEALIQFQVARNKVPFTYSIIWVTLENPLLLISNSFGGEAEAP